MSVPMHQPQSQEPREFAEREARHQAYAEIQAGSLFARFDPLRRVTTLEREVRSWPQFLLCVLLAGAAYFLIGQGSWDFRNPETGELDWLLVGVFWAVCASFVWLIWPLPKKKAED